MYTRTTVISKYNSTRRFAEKCFPRSQEENLTRVNTHKANIIGKLKVTNLKLNKKHQLIKTSMYITNFKEMKWLELPQELF